MHLYSSASGVHPPIERWIALSTPKRNFRFCPWEFRKHTTNSTHCTIWNTHIEATEVTNTTNAGDAQSAVCWSAIVRQDENLDLFVFVRNARSTKSTIMLGCVCVCVMLTERVHKCFFERWANRKNNNNHHHFDDHHYAERYVEALGTTPPDWPVPVCIHSRIVICLCSLVDFDMEKKSLFWFRFHNNSCLLLFLLCVFFLSHTSQLCAVRATIFIYRGACAHCAPLLLPCALGIIEIPCKSNKENCAHTENN